MSDTKEQAKLEIKDIIDKIKKGESPNTSRAHELIGEFNLSGLEAEMTKAAEEAAAKNNTVAGKDPEVSLDPIKTSENFFKDPEVKEILDTHKVIAEDNLDVKKHRNKLIKASDSAEKHDDFNKKQIETLEKQRESLLSQAIDGTISAEDFATGVVKHTDNIIKHKQILGHSEITKTERKENGLKSNKELFADNGRASRIAEDINKNNKAISHKEIDHAQSLLESLRPPEKKQEHSAPTKNEVAPTRDNSSPPENFDKFKESTRVEYVNLGAARTPSSTPGKSQGQSKGKAAA